MNRKLELVITRCAKCPFYRWEPNESCSNSAGNSICSLRWLELPMQDRLIERNNKDPEIPNWCPLPVSEA